MMRQPRIIKSYPSKKPLHLIVEWADHTSSEIDLSSLIQDFEFFRPLEEVDLFSQATEDEWGWSVHWGDQIDIGSDTLWRLALEQRGDTMSPVNFREWRRRNNLSLVKAAEALGLGKRMLIYYEKGEKIIPKVVLLATLGYESKNIEILSQPTRIESKLSQEEVFEWIHSAITAKKENSKEERQDIHAIRETIEQRKIDSHVIDLESFRQNKSADQSGR